MSLHLDSNKENIIENFSIFFHKIIESRPNHEEHTKEFTVLKKYLLEEGQDFSKANNFIKSLKEKYQSKTTGTEKELSSNLDLKNFNLKKKAGTTPGITKFNQIPLKDYLIKNSIILSEDNKLCHRFSHIKEFLPDSQNFYRVLGLGVLEAYLTNETYQNRLKKIYEDTLNQIIPLSMNVYPFTPNELRATFCGYLKQLLTIQEEQPEPRKLKELLFEMCHKDPVFDVALITLTKEIILSKISGSSSMPRDFSNRIKSSDSSLINDIISLIPDALEINLIVEVVQENKIKESIYPSRNPRENPNLNIIHEKQSSYQNFHLLSFEEHDTFNDKEGKTHLRHLSSAAYEKPSKPAKAFGSDSKHQANFERTAPVQLHFESDHLYQQKTLDPSSTRPTINIGEYNAPSLRTPHSAHGHLSIRTTVDDKAVVNEAFEQKLISDSRSSKNLHTPSKPKKIISGDSSEDKLAQRSNRKNPELISSPNKSNLPVLVPLEDNQFKGTLVTPNGKQKSPLNIYATLINGRSPRSDECSYYSPTNNKNPKLLTKSPTQVNQKSLSFKAINDLQTMPVLTHSHDNKDEAEVKRKSTQSKFITMIPKAMETIPLNPFSTFSHPTINDKYNIINPMSGNVSYNPTLENYLERKTTSHHEDKIYSTTHYGGSGVSNSFRRYTHNQNTYSGKSTNTYDIKSRKNL